MEASIVIATKDRPEKLRDTLLRLAAQEPGAPAYEVVVVDDGSEPRLAPEAPPGLALRVVRQPPRERSAARNLGAREAKGRILIFIDDDIWVRSDFVEKHVEAHQAAEPCYVVGAIRLPERCQRTPFGRFRQALEDEVLPAPGENPPANLAAAGNLSLPREEFLRLGGFDEGLSSSEDQDLALRAGANGIRGVYRADIAVEHQDSALDLAAYARRSEWGYRNMVRFVRRYPDLPDNVARERVNGPLVPGREPVTLSLKKMSKSILSRWPFEPLLRAAVRALEALWPASPALPPLYRTLLGLSIFRGYRAGLRDEARARAPRPAGPMRPTEAGES